MKIYLDRIYNNLYNIYLFDQSFTPYMYFIYTAYRCQQEPGQTQGEPPIIFVLYAVWSFNLYRHKILCIHEVPHMLLGPKEYQYGPVL